MNAEFLFPAGQPIPILKWKLAPATIWYLAMEEAPAFELHAAEGLEIRLILQPVDTTLYRRMYYSVGKPWNWLDRLVMLETELAPLIQNDRTTIHTLHEGNKFLGYCEWVREKDFTELQYFGLIPEATGKGAGSFFLRWALNNIGQTCPGRIQVNTCSLDHPTALGLYQKVGFRIYKTLIDNRKVPV